MSIFGKSKGEINMTQGNMAAHLIRFAIPLIMGNLFQMLYNMVDTWVVGNYVSDDAFSAVGTVGPVMNLFIYAFVGFTSGAGVVISQYFGAGDTENVKKTVHTMFSLTMICCVVFSALAWIFAPQMIRLMKSPDGIFDEQLTYLRIIFAFMSFQIIYNMSAAILRAIGDSVRPFIFLVVTALGNIGLDLLFVLKFRMGVEGVAWATIISQGISATLCLYVLLTTDSCVKLKLSELVLDTKIAKLILKIAIPTAIQQSITSFSNIFVQGYVNVFGGAVMGGWTIYNKVDQIIMLPQQSFGMSVSTFVGQNLGAGNEKRAKKGMWQGIGICAGMSAVLIAVILAFAPSVAGFFTESSEIVYYGVYFLFRITPFMLICCISMVMISGLRGSGNSTVPMIVNLGCFVGFRQLYLYTVSHIWPGNLAPVAIAYPMGWVLCAIIILIYYAKVGFGVKGVIEQKK